MKVYDPQGNEFDKEPIDARECVNELGWSYERPDSAAAPSAETMGAALSGGQAAPSQKRGRKKAVENADPMMDQPSDPAADCVSDNGADS